jgi:hypothetical protein
MWRDVFTTEIPVAFSTDLSYTSEAIVTLYRPIVYRDWATLLWTTVARLLLGKDLPVCHNVLTFRVPPGTRIPSSD